MAELSSYTELDAINEILSSIGDSPLNTLENLVDADAINAQKILALTNRQFQSRGWSFNHMDAYTLNPDENTHKILWLDNIIYIQGTNGEKFVKKGDYLYDMKNSTFIFLTAPVVNLILLVPLDEMPEQARAYIVAKASMLFEARYLGDVAMSQVLSNVEREAWSNLQEYEMENNSYNILDNEYIAGLK